MHLEAKELSTLPTFPLIKRYSLLIISPIVVTKVMRMSTCTDMSCETFSFYYYNSMKLKLKDFRNNHQIYKTNHDHIMDLTPCSKYIKISTY